MEPGETGMSSPPPPPPHTHLVPQPTTSQMALDHPDCNTFRTLQVQNMAFFGALWCGTILISILIFAWFRRHLAFLHGLVLFWALATHLERCKSRLQPFPVYLVTGLHQGNETISVDFGSAASGNQQKYFCSLHRLCIYSVYS